MNKLFYEGVGAEALDYIKKTSRDVHQQAVEGGWWNDLSTGESLIGKRDFIALCGLVVTEITEAYDGWEGNLFDDKLPLRKQDEVELADAFIRLGDLAVGHGVDFDAGTAQIEEEWFPFYGATHGFPERLMRIIGYVSYAMEGHRKRNTVKRDTNIVKAMYAIMVMGGQCGMDIKGAIIEKSAFNRVRPDHKAENRRSEDGKKE